VTDVVVGMRVRDAKVVVPGSRKVGCAGCGETTWLAQPGQRMAARGATVVCQVCGEELMPGANSVRPAPGAMAEVSSWLRRN
jgi:hypothetical protein